MKIYAKPRFTAIKPLFFIKKKFFKLYMFAAYKAPWDTETENQH